MLRQLATGTRGWITSGFLAREQDPLLRDEFEEDVNPDSTSPTLALVAAKHEGLDRQQQRLNSKDHGVHNPNGIHRVKNQALEGADVA
jgi:hypothetical protein